MFGRAERPYHPRMRTQRASLLAAVLLLAACSSETSKGNITPGETTAPPGSSAPGTTGAVETTLPDVWVQPTAAPTMFFTESLGTYEAPDFVIAMMTADGTRTDLWTETVGNGVVILDATPDVAADAGHLLLRRYAYDEAAGTSNVTIAERDLASGEETTVMISESNLYAKYVRDGSGEILVSYGVDHVDSTGVITSTTQYLDRVDANGKLIANLLTGEADGGGSDIDWLQVQYEGQPAVALGGTPITILGPAGAELASLGNDRSCSLVRQVNPGTVLAACADTTEYVTQLWLVPLDGTAPQQITHVVVDPSGIDFGAWNLWSTVDGKQWVQRTGDCGAVWVEELQPDGTTVDAPVSGWILGTDGTRVISAVNANCDGGQAVISSYDSSTGETTTLLAPPEGISPDAMAVNGFEVLAVPRSLGS